MKAGQRHVDLKQALLDALQQLVSASRRAEIATSGKKKRHDAGGRHGDRTGLIPRR